MSFVKPIAKSTITSMKPTTLARSITANGIARRLGVADPAAQRVKQADLLRAAWERLVDTPDGAGVALVTQYLFHTDPRYDSGLCETAESGGARRPAFAAWRELPSVD